MIPARSERPSHPGAPMKFSAERESLLAALQSVIGVVERRQTMPILANLLLSAESGKLSVTATDLEVELVASTEIKSAADSRVTVPGRKLLDICRSLPEGVDAHVQPGRRQADGQSRQEPLRARHPPRQRFSGHRRARAAAEPQAPAGGLQTPPGQDALFHGAAGRPLLLEWNVAGNGRENAANGRD